MGKKQQGLRYKLHIWRLMRKDYGRCKHTDWRFLFVWLMQMSAATAFFLISLGAFVSCGWGILSYLMWIPDPEGVPALQNLEWDIQDYKIYHYIRMAVGLFRTLCAQNYFNSIVLLLGLFSILVIALSILLNRLTEACNIRRYNVR